jgi:tRNA (mo5U34)-methyltransferase
LVVELLIPKKEKKNMVLTPLFKIIVKIKSQIEKIRVYFRFRKYTPSLDPPPSGMAKETVLKKIAEVPFWWHYIEVGYGLLTPGHQRGPRDPTGPNDYLEKIQLPKDLTGKSVLDIGAWDGLFSFESEKRGASKVLAIDNFYRDKKEWTESQGFEVAKEILNSKVEFKKASVYDLSPEKFGMFDIVLFLGVFYHLKYPILALEKIYSVTKEMLIIETHYDPYHPGKTPLATFYEGDEINKDPTTWWGFNEAGLLAVLRSVGFKNPRVLYRYADRIIIKAFK